MRPHRLLVIALCAIVASSLCAAVLAEDGYRTPPAEIVRMLDAPPPPVVSVGPAGEMAVVLQRESMPGIEELAAPMLRLAGIRINPKTNGRHMPWWSFTSMAVKPIGGGSATEIRLPEEAKIGYPRWSPDGSKLAFTLTFGDRIELWSVETERMRARRVGGFHVNEVLGGGFQWMPDSERLLVATVPPNRSAAPSAPETPSGPVVQETSGRTSPVRTYQDLLESPHDEALFEHFGASQLVLAHSERYRSEHVGPVAMYSDFEVAPDGVHVLAAHMVRPYSYLVTYRDFPDVVQVFDLRTGRAKEIARRPLRDETPIGGVPTGPRGFEWKSTSPATLMWAEALDGGDPDNEVAHRDKLMLLDAPFEGTARELYRTPERFSGAIWIADSDRCLVADYDRDKRWTKTWLLDATSSNDNPPLVFDRSVQDRYGDPGYPVRVMNESGHTVAHAHEGAIFLSGRGSTPEGDRPFLDRMPLATLEPERLWRAEGDVFESFEEMLADDGSVILTQHESKTQPPNYFVRNLATGMMRPFTDYTDPMADFAGSIQKELVTYERNDGVTLSATLYLPADYEEGERLPLVVWAYPREFNSASDAGQVSGSEHRYTRISGPSHLFYLTQGYAVMDSATMPVVGDDPETVNDTFIEQIVASAQAAIDFADERGVGDPERVGVGGHSYGAFMTANLLAHCDLFSAGVARSGAYNRTLTPFGFQSERRTFWEAPEIYFALSPFMHADEIDEPVLLIHGMIDNNSGTFPIQSERLYHAIKGHGGTARLVMLPEESHGYRARESVHHVVAEMIEWFDRHVKNAGTPTGSSSRDASGE